MNTRKKTVCGVLAVILALTFAACGDDGGNTDKELSGNISISPASASVEQILTATYTGTETVSYQWKKDGGNVGTNLNNYTPTAAGSYTVTVSVAGYNSKTSAAVSVTVATDNGDACDCIGIEDDCECVNCECETCEPIDPTHIHEWGNFVVTTHATCTTPGVETRTCTLNAAHTQRQAIAIDLNAHSWGAWVVTTPATETQDGEEKRTCAHNAAHVETNALAALNHAHVWGAWEVITPPACTEKGERERVCQTNSAHKDYEDIDPTGHDWETIFTIVPATETTDGVKLIRCTRNNAHTKDEEFSGEYATGTTGLAFELIDNNTAYRVRKGTVVTNAVHIPAYRLYNGNYLPVTEIGSASDTVENNAFGNYESLATVTFADGSQLKTISNHAFRSCSNLTSFIIPTSVTSIGDSAFAFCTSLTSFIIPASVTFIDEWGISFCTGITSITIPATVTSVRNYVFYNWTDQQSIYILGSTSGWTNWRTNCSAKVYQWNEGTQNWDQI